MNGLTLSQLDEVLASVKERFLSESVSILRNSGAKDSEVMLFRQSTDATLVAYNMRVLSEVQRLIAGGGGAHDA